MHVITYISPLYISNKYIFLWIRKQAKMWLDIVINDDMLGRWWNNTWLELWHTEHQHSPSTNKAMNRLKASSSEGKKSTSYAPRNETRDKCRISQWPENTGSHPSSEFPRESRNKLLPTQKIYLKQRGWNTQRVHPNAIKPSTRQEAKIMLDRADIITDLIWVWINMISSKANAQHLLL